MKFCGLVAPPLFPLLLVSLLFVPAVQATSITAVAAPNLTRPMDNVAYPFTISVSGTYWAEDVFFDDPIDLHAAGTPGALNVPAPGAGDVVGSPHRR